MEKVPSKAVVGYFHELCKANISPWKGSMVPERKRDGNYAGDRETYGKNSVGSTAHRWNSSWGLDADVISNDYLMFCLKETIHQLAVANSVCLCGHVLGRGMVMC